MGIALAGSGLLLQESQKTQFQGAVLQLGRQDIYFSYADFTKQARALNISLKNLEKITTRENPYCPALDTIDDHCFFQSLGFDTVHSLDIHSSQDSTYIWDLNTPVPESLHNQYDVIFDGGTSEHIFHIPNVLRNIHYMLKENGKIIHFSPTHNYVDHGFYMFSPTLYSDYYESNRYEICTALLVGHTTPVNHFEEPILVNYRPGILDQFSVGGFNKERFRGCDVFSTFFSAIKTQDSVWGMNPQQGYYRRQWESQGVK
ncbi:MAG: hypothetical protein NPIRA02_03020 [Nitrospirales bacterium]|nr:MAG: hypothetical protein NPIRA02_03020 [Nitrospirales bacterium]